MLVFAHLGHILVDAPLFAGPVLMLMLALLISARGQKHQAVRSRTEAPLGEGGDPAP